MNAGDAQALRSDAQGSLPKPDASGQQAPGGGGTDVPGWFGKLAGLGDFASRRLPSAWIEACDAWLSGLLLSTRADLGEVWLDAYLHAPLLRMAWAPGVLDAQWWMGVLMPSCDSAGRYYPLVIAAPWRRAPTDAAALDHLECWWRHVAHAALRTLHDELDAAGLEQLLADAPAWPADAGGVEQGPVPAVATPHGALPAAADLSGETAAWPVPAGASLASALQDEARRQLQQAWQGCTLWWPWRDEPQASTRVHVIRGLPDASDALHWLTAGHGPGTQGLPSGP